jgi:hypothetical protein
MIINLLIAISFSISSKTDTENLKINNSIFESIKKLNNEVTCNHFAYHSSSDFLCWIYKLFLFPPYNSTCVCSGSGSMDFYSSGTWTTDDRLLVTDYNDGALYEIDLEECAIITIGGGGVGINGLTCDPISGKVYGCSNYELFEIDPDTGEQEYIGNFNIGFSMIEIACDANGDMYGWDVKFSGESYLYKIEKDSGEASIVGVMGITLCYAQDGDFCKECDTLFLSAYVYSPENGNFLIECDKNTGECEILGGLNNYEGFFVIPFSDTNILPIAEFNWTPEVPQPSEEITFNASESCDPDGYIKLYEWDWNNDGIFDEKNYTSPIAKHIFSEEGYYPVTLRVHDYNFTNSSVSKTVRVGNKPPESPIITGPTKGKAGENYNYTFVSTDPDGDNITYYIGWGDKEILYIYGPYPSGEPITLPYNWSEKGKFTIQCKARDIYDAESNWTYLEVTMPRSYNSFWFFQYWLEKFPILLKFFEKISWFT